jgi:hypothetical protein
MVDTRKNVRFDAVVDLAGADKNDVELCLRRLRAQLPLSVRVHTVDLSRCSLESLELSGTHVIVLDPAVDLMWSAFDMIAIAIDDHPDSEVFYGQETEGPDREPTNVPRWSPERLRNENYLPGALIVARSALSCLGVATTPAPLHRWEMALRISEMQLRVERVAATLSHRRVSRSHADHSPDVTRQRVRILQAHCNRIGLHALAVPGPLAGTTRARRILDEAPEVALILPGPHPAGGGSELVNWTSDDRLSVVVVCGPNDPIPDTEGNVTIVRLPEDTDDLAERIRWGLSGCTAEFVACAPGNVRSSDPMWLAHLASLLGPTTIAAGPLWRLDAHLDEPTTAVEAEVTEIAIAGTVMRRESASELFARVRSRQLDWFDRFTLTGAPDENLVVSPDVRLALQPEPPASDVDVIPSGWFRRPRRRLFPLPA